MKWSKEQVDALDKILKLQAEFKLSDVDIAVYADFEYLVNHTEEGMSCDMHDTCEERAGSYAQNSIESEEYFEEVMKENWDNEEVFNYGV